MMFLQVPKESEARGCFGYQLEKLKDQKDTTVVAVVLFSLLLFERIVKTLSTRAPYIGPRHFPQPSVERGRLQ